MCVFDMTSCFLSKWELLLQAVTDPPLSRAHTHTHTHTRTRAKDDGFGLDYCLVPGKGRGMTIISPSQHAGIVLVSSWINPRQL